MQQAARQLRHFAPRRATRWPCSAGGDAPDPCALARPEGMGWYKGKCPRRWRRCPWLWHQSKVPATAETSISPGSVALAQLSERYGALGCLAQRPVHADLWLRPGPLAAVLDPRVSGPALKRQGALGFLAQPPVHADLWLRPGPLVAVLDPRVRGTHAREVGGAGLSGPTPSPCGPLAQTRTSGG